MPIEQQKFGFSTPLVREPDESPPNLSDVVGAAFRQENDILNFLDVATRKTIPRDPNFKLRETLEQSPYWEDRERFLGVESQDEFNATAARIEKEKKDRATYAAGGVTGLVAGVAAGAFSPMTLLPLTTGARGIKAVMSGAGLGLVGVGAQEAVLYAAQKTRTPEEAAINVATGVVLGGILGGAVGNLSRTRRMAVESDMGLEPSHTPISRLGVQGTDGAEIRIKSVGGEWTFHQKVGAKTLKINFKPENMLVVTPESVRTIAKDLPGQLTNEAVVKFAKQQGYDAVAFQGFEHTLPPLPDGHVRLYQSGATPGRESVSPSAFYSDLTAAKAAADETTGVLTYVDVPKERLPTTEAAFRGPIDEDLSRTARTFDDDGGLGALLTNDIVPIDKSKYAVKEVVEGTVPTPSFGTGVEEILSPRDFDTAVTGGYSEVGAAKSRSQSAGALKRGADFLDFASPVTRTINQGYLRTAQWAMAQLSNAGLRLEGNVRGIATAAGGTAEHRINPYYGILADVLTQHKKLYQDYILGPQSGGRLSGLKASLRGLTPPEGKLSYKEFREEIGVVIDSGEKSPVKEVNEAASLLQDKIYNYILEEGKSTGIFPESVKVLAAKGYLNRVYRDELIEQDFTGFVDLLAENFTRKLTDDFNTRLGGLQEAAAKTEQRIEDLNIDYEEAKALRDQFMQELTDFESAHPEQILQEDLIRTLRASARRPGRSALEKAQYLEQADEAKKAAGDDLENFKKQRAKLRARVRNLGRSKFAVEQRLQGKLDRIDRIEELNLNALRRVIRTSEIAKDRLARVSDDRLEGELDKLQSSFEDVADILRRGEDKIEKIQSSEDPDAFTKVMGVANVQEARWDRLERLATRIGRLEGIDRESVRAEIDAVLEEALQRTNRLISKRALREAKLEEAAKKLGPETIDAEVAALRKQITTRKQDFVERMRERGADDIDLEKGVANFRPFARDLAEETAHKILGTHGRLPAMDVLTQKRGAELLRTLDIEREFTHNGRTFKDFLEQDVERLASTYVRTLAPDIEIARKFGTSDGTLMFQELTDEYNAAHRKISNGVGLDGKKLTDKQKEKQLKELTKTFKDANRDLMAVIGRLRHQWGLPRNPRGMATRMGRVAMNLNVLRFMGAVTISSIPDLARPIQKYGLVRTFRDGYIPFVTGLKEMALTVREAQLAGVGVDAILHTRAREIFDLLDNSRTGSTLERGLDYATSRMGMVALFDYWTDAMKQISASVVNAKLIDSIEAIAKGKASKEEIEFLAASGLDGQMVERIWGHIIDGSGGNRVNGVWLPNTESWVKQTEKGLVPDYQAITAYRQALAGNVNDTIITPGVERPLIADASLAHKMIFQFRSFGLSSTTKTLMAGLQQRDAAFMTGTLVSLALGSLSYYLWAVAVGGKSYQEMLNASPSRWADEAISRSGNLAVLGEVQRFAENIPAVSQTPLRYAFGKFSESQSTRRSGGDLYDAMFGPSFDLGIKAGGVLMDLDEPTQSTAHKLRQMTPYQNLFLLRRAFDAAEQGASDVFGLPERRQK